MYKLLYSPQAQKDAKKIASSNLKGRVELLLNIISQNPYAFPPPFEFLTGNLKGFISRRINKQHRLVYEVLEAEKIIKVFRMWTHYE
ncbi:MAG: Txe/YoeB family addiction module toxin [Ignavibacteriaceae bacterium]|nr:Txe/YoeB family addiction module toxin [Ignavibacteriaceae bacterium]